MMFLPRLSIMLCSTRVLKCHVGVCDELLEFLLYAGKHFLWHIYLPSALTHLESSFHVSIAMLTLYFVGPFLNFMQFASSCFINFLRGRLTQNVVPRWIFFQNSFRIHKFLNLFCNSLHVLLVLVGFVVKDAVNSKINTLFEFLLRPSATLWWNWVGPLFLQLLLGFPRQAQSVGAPMNQFFSECYLWSFSRPE